MSSKEKILNHDSNMRTAAEHKAIIHLRGLTDRAPCGVGVMTFSIFMCIADDKLEVAS